MKDVGKIKCPICNDENAALFTKSRDYQNLDDDKDYFAYKCKICGVVFQHPFPKCEDFDRIYKENYYAHIEDGKIPNSSRLLDFLLEHKMIVAVTKPLIKLVFPYIYILKESISILDVGCGKGIFLDILKKHNKTTYGIDLDSNAIDIIKKNGHKAFKGDIITASFNDNTFDVITMFQVFEHIENPIQVLNEIFRILKSTGKLIIVTPNSNSTLSIENKNYWRGLELPRHVILHNPSSIKFLLDENKFKYKISTRVSPIDTISTTHLKNQFCQTTKPRSKFYVFFDIVKNTFFNYKNGSLLTVIVEKI